MRKGGEGEVWGGGMASESGEKCERGNFSIVKIED